MEKNSTNGGNTICYDLRALNICLCMRVGDEINVSIHYNR